MKPKTNFAARSLPRVRLHRLRCYVHKDLYKPLRLKLLPSLLCGIYMRLLGAELSPPSPAQLFSAHTPHGSE